MRPSSRLALHGGVPRIRKKFRRYNSLGPEELRAATQVIRSGILSQFLGTWDPDFYGGPRVREFEKACCRFFRVNHAVTVNSWTSGLTAAIGAIGIEPGDEVIVPTWTMCASATAVLHWWGIPVFADIDPLTFCMDPRSVEKNLTPRTRAILAVDIFGQSCDLDALRKIANKKGLRIVGDTAQAPGTWNCGRVTGTLADIGGYSLNYHKHIHTGEGGILVTNDANLAERAQLIRNHAEAVVGGKGVKNLVNMVGHNFRLGEIEAAMGTTQLKKLPRLVRNRQRAAERLTRALQGLPGLRLPYVRAGCTHAYYMYPMVLDPQALGVDRAWIIKALRAEGVPDLSPGYANVHCLPIYQKKIAFGSRGFPWSLPGARGGVRYGPKTCPVAEDLHDRTFMAIHFCAFEMSDAEIDLLAAAFHKVWNHLPRA